VIFLRRIPAKENPQITPITQIQTARANGATDGYGKTLMDGNGSNDTVVDCSSAKKIPHPRVRVALFAGT
jgi:hypothetical protein